MSEVNYLRGLTKEEFSKVMKDCIDKVEGVNDLDWQDIVDKYDLQIHRDVLRKAFQSPIGGYSVYKYLSEDKTDISDEDILKEIELKKLELIKERKKLQATKTELMRNLTHSARFELFYENIKEAIETLPLPKFETIVDYKEGNEEYVLSFADIHYGANFTSENNEYSREICKQRFEKLLHKTIKYIDKESIGHLKVLNQGDTIQGILRMTDLKLNEVPIVQAVVEISRLIANFLNELSAYTNVTYYHTMSANHSQTRPLGSKASELATEDMELVIGNYIKDLLSNNKRVEVVLSEKDYTILDICGFDCISMHGHQIKNIKKCIQDYSMLHRKFYQYCFLGHTHAGQTIVTGEGYRNSIEVLVTPSFCGSDPYSDNLKVGAKAMAKIYKFEEYSGLTQTTNIILN